MKKSHIINIVATECRPEDEEKFNKWYDNVHIPMLLKFKGLLNVDRLGLISGSDKHPKYLALYEFKDAAALEAFQKSPELAAARDEMSETWKGKGFEIKWRAQYGCLNNWQKQALTTATC